MDAQTHFFYGIILGEIIYNTIIKKNGNKNQYNRVQLWLLGGFGCFLPDLDTLSGIIQYLLGSFSGTLTEAGKIYHRNYSHGLFYLIPFVILAFISYILFKKNEQIDIKSISAGVNTKEIKNSNPLGDDNPQISWINIILMIIFVILNLMYNSTFKFIFSFLILFFGILVIISFIIFQKKSMYAFAISLGIIFHLFLDFIRGDIQPFGPWDPSYNFGLYIYPAGKTELIRFVIFYIIFEISADIIAVIIIVRVIIEYNKFIKK